jgi:hypothetical protein
MFAPKRWPIVAVATIALAIIAAQTVAWLCFNTVHLDKPKAPLPKGDSIEVTVAAANIFPMMKVKPIQVKKVKLAKADYDALVQMRGHKPLKASQAVGRVTKRIIRAETPFFEDDLGAFALPDPEEKFLRPANPFM